MKKAFKLRKLRKALVAVSSTQSLDAQTTVHYEHVLITRCTHNAM